MREICRAEDVSQTTELYGNELNMVFAIFSFAQQNQTRQGQNHYFSRYVFSLRDDSLPGPPDRHFSISCRRTSNQDGFRQQTAPEPSPEAVPHTVSRLQNV